MHLVGLLIYTLQRESLQATSKPAPKMRWNEIKSKYLLMKKIRIWWLHKRVTVEDEKTGEECVECGLSKESSEMQQWSGVNMLHVLSSLGPQELSGRGTQSCFYLEVTSGFPESSSKVWDLFYVNNRDIPNSCLCKTTGLIFKNSLCKRIFYIFKEINACVHTCLFIFPGGHINSALG